MAVVPFCRQFVGLEHCENVDRQIKNLNLTWNIHEKQAEWILALHFYSWPINQEIWSCQKKKLGVSFVQLCVCSWYMYNFNRGHCLFPPNCCHFLARVRIWMCRYYWLVGKSIPSLLHPVPYLYCEFIFVMICMVLCCRLIEMVFSVEMVEYFWLYFLVCVLVSVLFHVRCAKKVPWSLIKFRL